MLEKVTDRIYYLMNNDDTDRPALGLIRGNDCCLVIDAGNSPTHAKEFQKEIALLDLPPVRYVVLTHYHWDHTFGIGAWNATTIGNQSTYDYIHTYTNLKYDDMSLDVARESNIFNDYSLTCIKAEIQERDHFKPYNCNLIYSEELKIDLGGITCFIKQMVSPHTNDSTIVYVPEEKTLFLGDSIYGYTWQGFNYFNKDKVYQMIDVVEQMEADYYLCSHESICTKDEMVTYWNQLRMGARIAEKCNNIEEAKTEFIQTYGKEPNGEDLFFIKSFGEGEAWGRRE